MLLEGLMVKPLQQINIPGKNLIPRRDSLNNEKNFRFILCLFLSFNMLQKQYNIKAENTTEDQAISNIITIYE